MTTDGGLLDGTANQQERALVNTVLSLAGASCVCLNVCVCVCVCVFRREREDFCICVESDYR